MCLNVIKNPKNEKSKTRKTVYKVFWVTPDGAMFNLYRSISKFTEYCVGKTATSSRWQVKMYDQEKCTKEIYHGFHCFTTLSGAKHELNFWNTKGSFNCRMINGLLINGKFCIYECKVTPRYHIADGIYSTTTFNGFVSKYIIFPCSVYHKITPIREIV